MKILINNIYYYKRLQLTRPFLFCYEDFTVVCSFKGILYFVKIVFWVQLFFYTYNLYIYSPANIIVFAFSSRASIFVFEIENCV